MAIDDDGTPLSATALAMQQISKAATTWALDPFGDRFCLTVNNGSFDVKLLLSSTDMKNLEGRCKALRGEGRAVKRELKRRKAADRRG